MGLSLVYKNRVLSNSFGNIVNAPIGAIMIWSGTENNVPEGWSICNGQNGTIDLRDKFVLAAGESHPVGETGGSEEVTLTVAQMPEHSHKIETFIYDSGSGTVKIKRAVQPDGTATMPINAMSIAGSSQPHPNMPPYYTLLYIQKTGVTPSDYATVEQVEEIVQEALREPPAGSNVPTGGIIIWSGASNAVPDGWALCDGTNGTPDLRGRFVLGESENYSVGETGGSEEVTLTVAQMPEHEHVENVGKSGVSKKLVTYSGSGGSIAGAYASASDTSVGQIVVKTDRTGSSQPHPNMPPYYVLAYIMYVGGDAMW